MFWNINVTTSIQYSYSPYDPYERDVIDGNLIQRPAKIFNLTWKFLLPARNSANASTTLAKVVLFDAIVPKYLSLGQGVFSIDVTIVDNWGASTIFTIPTPVTVKIQFCSNVT